MWSGKGSNCRPSAFQLVCRSDEGAQIILIWIYPDLDGAGAPFPVGISAPGWCQGQRPGRHRPCLAWPRTHSGPGRVTKRSDELCPGRPRRVPKYLAEVLVSGARAEEQLRGGLCVGAPAATSRAIRSSCAVRLSRLCTADDGPRARRAGSSGLIRHRRHLAEHPRCLV